MTHPEKIKELKEIIQSSLSPIINHNYILIDIPYHPNIGDILIWQGEMDFLSTLPYKCIRMSSNAWRGGNLNSSDNILLHGGGNFGDLYREMQEYRLFITEKFPNNRIIMFPQSIWYNDSSLIKKDAKIFSKHPDLHLCARDQWSYDFLKKYFSNNIYLIPDLAFFIKEERFKNYINSSNTNKHLYFFIKNKEIGDWPLYGQRNISWSIIHKLLKISKTLWITSPKIGDNSMKIIDQYCTSILMPKLVTRGIEWLSQYDTVTPTRLHGLILSVLLNKNITYIDNISGKLSAFANTWLSDLDNLSPYNPNTSVSLSKI